MKTWAEVSESPEFSALSADEQGNAREQYFLDAVAPKVPRDQLLAARRQFDADTYIRKQDLPEGMKPAVRGLGRGGFDPATMPIRDRVARTLADVVRPAANPAPAIGDPMGSGVQDIADAGIAAPVPAAPPRVQQPAGASPGNGRGFVNPPEAQDYGAVDAYGSSIAPEEMQRQRMGTDNTARPFTATQLGRDFKGGVEQVKSLATGAGAFAGAADWKAATDTLADLDAIDAGQAPQRTVPAAARADGALRPGEPGPLLKAYLAGSPESRQKIRASLLSGVQRDQGFIAESAKAIKAYGAEQQRLSGQMPDFTDIKTAKDFGVWAVRNGVATTPTMAGAMLGALAGPLGLAATSGAMALGDMTSARVDYANKEYDPARFTSPDRYDDAKAAQAGLTAAHLGSNVNRTAALVVPYAALDFLGPAGTLATGGAKGLAAKGARAIAKKGALEVGEEALNEGGQEVVNVASDVGAGERPPEWTGADTNRIINSAAVGGVMGAGGHAANVVGDKGREISGAAGDAFAAERAASEQARQEQQARRARQDEAEAQTKAYTDLAASKGFGQPAAPAPPATERRKAAVSRFDEFVAEHGMAPAAATAIKDAIASKPLAEIPGFIKRATQALAKRGLFRGPVDDAALGVLDEPPPAAAPADASADPNNDGSGLSDSSLNAADILGPDETLPTSQEAQAPGAQAPASAGGDAARGDGVGASGLPAEPAGGAAQADGLSEVPDLTSHPTDAAAHAAATSPTNERPEPTEAQKQAGNYAKGSVRIGGLDISIENPQGSTRKGVSPEGVPWVNMLLHHYGYVRGTVGADKDHVDVFVKPGTPSDHAGPVFVVDQIDPKSGRFDEHKGLIGFDTEKEARAAYQANYAPDWKGGAGITQMPMQAFKSWVKDGAKRKPLGNINPEPANGTQRTPADDAAAPNAGAPVQADSGRAAPAPATPAPRVIAAAGRTPNSTEPLELRPNADGTLTPHLGRDALVDFDSGKPIVLPKNISDLDAKKAIRDAGAVSKKVNFYPSTKAEAAPAPDTTPPAPQGNADRPGPAKPEAAPREEPAKAAKTPKSKKHPAELRGSGALASISERLGGISPDLLADLSDKKNVKATRKNGKAYEYVAWDNPPAPGFGPLFRKGGSADLSEIARVLEEEGYIEPGLNERDPLEASRQAQDIIKAEMKQGGATVRAYDPDAAEAEMKRRAEVANDTPEAEPWDSFDFTPDDLDAAGYNELAPEVRDATDDLLAQAEAAGLDTETMRDGVARQTDGQSENAYHAALQDALRGVLVGSRGETASADTGAARAGDQSGGEAAGDQSEARAGSRSDGQTDRPDGAEEEGLTRQASASAAGLGRYRGEVATSRDAAAELESPATKAGDVVLVRSGGMFDAPTYLAEFSVDGHSYSSSDAGHASAEAALRQAGKRFKDANPSSEFLTAQTEADLKAKTAREAAATEAARSKRAAEQERLRKEAEGRDNKARADSTVDDFHLGQSAEQQMSGMDDLFSQPEAPAVAPAPAPKPAPAAERPAELIELRKRTSVLQSLLDCMA